MYAEDIKKLTKSNTNFRTVLYTGAHSQVVAMSIPVGEDIGEEVHPVTDQLIFIVEGEVEAVQNGEKKVVDEHHLVFIPAGTLHNIRNIGSDAVKLFTVYAPPAHPDGTIHVTKEDAEKAEM